MSLGQETSCSSTICFLLSITFAATKEAVKLGVYRGVDNVWGGDWSGRHPCSSSSSCQPHLLAAAGIKPPLVRGFGSTSHPLPPWDRIGLIPLFFLPSKALDNSSQKYGRKSGNRFEVNVSSLSIHLYKAVWNTLGPWAFLSNFFKTPLPTPASNFLPLLSHFAS